jgi:hypothetical protein
LKVTLVAPVRFVPSTSTTAPTFTETVKASTHGPKTIEQL